MRHVADIFDLEFPFEPVYSGYLAAVVIGRPGPPGSGAGSVYEHSQTAPAVVWTVPHNLGRTPSVTVTDHLGNAIYADVFYVSSNIVQITHGAPIKGFAYCN